MRSSLGYALLALIAAKPQSGYDLSRQMRQPLGFFWLAQHSQIYPELARMQKAKLVESKEHATGDGPPRKVYTATPKGRLELAHWVALPPQERTVNDEMVIKAFAWRRVAPAALREVLKGQIEMHNGRLATLEQRATAMVGRSKAGTGSRSEAARLGEYAALRRAIGLEREYVAWCAWLLAELNRHRPVKNARRPARAARATRSGVAQPIR